jgi:glycosyltransferase involved in cell wall biosynthesis
MTELRVTVAVPCFNEAPTIAKVVREFKAALPAAEIIVFDNASTDDSARLAEEAGARIIRVEQRGKGNVVQSIFNNVTSDVCILVDGDDTYYADDVHALIAPLIQEKADVVVGSRFEQESPDALTVIRHLGNRGITWAINFVNRTSFKDVLSGYRAMNRRFLETVPVDTTGFEIETELTLRAVETGMVIREVPIRYRERPEDSYSKLNPFADGLRILVTIMKRLAAKRTRATSSTGRAKPTS